jgi:hypothetical protein
LRISFNEASLLVSDVEYPPSRYFRGGTVNSSEIECVVGGLLAPAIRTRDGEILIFGNSDLNRSMLEQFALKWSIPTVQYFDVWSDILEVILDTEISETENQRILDRLKSVGLSSEEVSEIRSEIAEMMEEYNMKSGLWEWVNLNMADLFDACIGKLNDLRMSDEYFEEFYWKAMRIQELGRHRELRKSEIQPNI